MVYALVNQELEKSSKARELMFELNRHGKMILSSQILVETSNILLRKIGLPAATVIDLIDDLKSIPTATADFELVREALVLTAISKINFWDALIVESAVASGCTVLYTEDLNHGQVIRGVKVVNPFL